MQRPIEKKFKFSPFATKPQITKSRILKRCLLIGRKVLYKSPNDIPFKLLTLHAINGWFVFPRITQTAIARTPDPKKIKQKTVHSFSFHIVTPLCQFMAQNSEIWGVKGPCGLYPLYPIPLYTIAPCTPLPMYHITPVPYWAMGHIGNEGMAYRGYGPNGKKIQITWHQGPLTESHKPVPHFCPSKDFLILTFIPLEHPEIDHSHHFWPPNPSTRHTVANRKNSRCLDLKP